MIIRQKLIKNEVISTTGLHDVQRILERCIESKIFRGFLKARNGDGGKDGHNAQGDNNFDEGKTLPA
jgi:hypothetical protein